MKIRGGANAVACPHCKVKLRIPPNVTEDAQLEPAQLEPLGRPDPAPGKSETKPSKTPNPSKASAEEPTVSRMAFVLLASYASAITLAFLWLLLFRGSHQLESLPDVRTLGDEELQFIGYDTPLPNGHALVLNETRRFGDVEVTPIKVTREPIQYQHYEDANATRPESDPVVKLWLKFRNVSDDVTFPPFDTALMSKRVEDDSAQVRANTFLAPADRPRTGDHILFNYDHPSDSEWNIADGIHSGLAPGAEATTFVASSEEDATKVAKGRFVWRVQFRKGVNRQSRRGVTTLVDVTFAASDIAPN